MTWIYNNIKITVMIEGNQLNHFGMSLDEVGKEIECYYGNLLNKQCSENV